MLDNAVYAIRPDVVHEVIDGELLAVDLQTGTYFSLEGVAGEVWALISAGAALDDIIRSISEAYAGDGIDTSLQSFIEELMGLELIAPNPEATSTSVAPAAKSIGGKKPFTPPKVNAYTDMQALLLFDPIHAVDETGWPNVTHGPD